MGGWGGVFDGLNILWVFHVIATLRAVLISIDEYAACNLFFTAMKYSVFDMMGFVCVTGVVGVLLVFIYAANDILSLNILVSGRCVNSVMCV